MGTVLPAFRDLAGRKSMNPVVNTRTRSICPATKLAAAAVGLRAEPRRTSAAAITRIRLRYPVRDRLFELIRPDFGGARRISPLLQ